MQGCDTDNHDHDNRVPKIQVHVGLYVNRHPNVPSIIVKGFRTDVTSSEQLPGTLHDDERMLAHALDQRVDQLIWAWGLLCTTCEMCKCSMTNGWSSVSWGQRGSSTTSKVNDSPKRQLYHCFVASKSPAVGFRNCSIVIRHRLAVVVRQNL